MGMGQKLTLDTHRLTYEGSLLMYINCKVLVMCIEIYQIFEHECQRHRSPATQLVSKQHMLKNVSIYNNKKNLK